LVLRAKADILGGHHGGLVHLHPPLDIDLVARWLNTEPMGMTAGESRELEMWLLSLSDEDAVEQQIARHLSGTLQTFSEFHRFTDSDCTDTALKKWREGVEKLCTAARREASGWSELLGQCCESQNLILLTTLSLTLKNLADTMSLSRKTSVLINQLCKRCGEWCSDFPVLPAADRSVHSADYIHKSFSSDVAERFGQLSLVLTHSDVSDRGQVDVVSDITKLAQQFDSGWPVDTTFMLSGLNALEELAASVGDVGTVVRDAICDLQRATLSTLQSTVDHSTPPETDQLDGIAEPLLGWLRSVSTEFTKAYLSSLYSSVAETDGSAENVIPVLLSTLVGLNRQMAEPEFDNRQAVELQKRMHVIIEEHGLTVVDVDLIGKSVAEVRQLVQIYRAYSTNSLPSDHIISVRQPGYLSKDVDGNTVVIRLAEVIVSA
ncbi:MAG: hypothetical protein ABGZ35_00935, partial [Planctomycetaceae bacterium]